MYNQARFLSSRISLHVVCEQTENLADFRVGTVHCLRDTNRAGQLWDRGLRRIGWRPHLGFLVRIARQERVRVIHSHFGPVALSNTSAARACNAKHVVSFYGADITQRPANGPTLEQRYHRLFEAVDAVLCEGPFMARKATALGCPEDKICIHHLGVNLKTLPFQPRKWQSGETLRVLLSGTFREKKGIPYAIRALGQTARRADIEITVIGDATTKPGDIEEKEQILDALRQTGLGRKTRLLGFQPHEVLIAEAYRNHLFICPSVTAQDGDAEGGAPVTLIEMAASGMPVVATTHCDIPNIIADGVSGFLVPERDESLLADAIGRLIVEPDRWQRLSENARRDIEVRFCARRQGRRLSEIYISLADSETLSVECHRDGYSPINRRVEMASTSCNLPNALNQPVNGGDRH
jgi:colanic acid/amylovoran biosynthesis glycosyltransferase